MSKPEPVAGVITDTHLNEENANVVFDIFKQFIDYLVKKQIKYALHLGDWFDKRMGQSLVCQLVTKAILALFEENKIQLICIPGNHDKTDYTNTLSYLHTYNFIDTSLKNWHNTYHPVLIDEPTNFILDQAPLLSLNFIPYFREDIYPEKLKQLQNQHLGHGIKSILFTHIGINGAINNDGSKVTNGVPLELFKTYDMIYSGHYHNRCVFSKVAYIGSAWQRDFGEDEQKGFHILYTNGDLKFVKTIFKKYYKFKVPTQDKNQLRLILKQNEKLLGDHFVRIIFTGSEDELNSIDVNSLRKMGVEVRSQNTKELKVDFDDIESTNFHVFTEKDILKNYLLYSKEYKFSNVQRNQGFKLLSTPENS